MEQLSKKMEIQGISKTYFNQKDYFTAIEDVSFDVQDGEFLVLLGPGRCGKTVLLNIIAGLEEKTTGSVLYDGREIKGVNPEVGMVFQKTALMPFKTVMENVELGLKFAGMKKKERREICQHYIDLVGLQGFENAYPAALSGGMNQRVGILNDQIHIFRHQTGDLIFCKITADHSQNPLFMLQTLHDQPANLLFLSRCIHLFCMHCTVF